jgi:putative heme-binding domain-containing protein
VFALEVVQRQLKAGGPAVWLQAAVELAESLRLLEAQDALTELAVKGRTSGEMPGDNVEPLRTAAMKALLSLDVERNIPVLGGVLRDASQPIGLREQSARQLGLTNNLRAIEQLMQALPTAQARLQTVLALSLAGSQNGGEKLLDAVTAGKASPRLLQDKAVETKLNEAKVPKLVERLKTLTEGLPKAEQKLQELLTKRREGFQKARPDGAAGAVVFEKHCAACHQISGKGAKVGPQLDGIGLRGVERLLEDMIDPNRNVDQAFRTTVLTLNNGRQVTGLLLRKEGEVLVLADNQGKEVRVAAGDVSEQALSQLSPMPSNFVEQVSESEFHDLLAFLLSQRAPLP